MFSAVFWLFFLTFLPEIVENSIVGGKAVKCSDGKLPLLSENRQLFPCARGCPDTFFCEKQASTTLCCPNITALVASASQQNKLELAFQLESTTELERIRPCERYQYEFNCKNSTVTMEQPVAKWYFDVATLSCEMYPLGLCLDAVLIEKLALKSKKECEERCDVANVRQALESLQEGNSIGGEDAVHLSRPEAQIAPPAHLAIDDVIQESKHIRGRPLAIEPPTDLIHVIHVKSDAHVHNRESFELKEIDEAQLLTSEEKDVPTVTSGVLHVLEDAGDVEGSGDSENVEKSPKSIEKSFERFYRRNKESVICTQTAYRLLCPSGAASQFVYRWEKVDGICQSFPYGYCLHEANSAHPRTRAECEQFCD